MNTIRKKVLALSMAAALTLGCTSTAWAADSRLDYSNDGSDASNGRYVKVTDADSTWSTSYYQWNGENDADGKSGFAVDFSEEQKSSFLNIEFDLRFGQEGGGFELREADKNRDRMYGGDPAIQASVTDGKLVLQRVSGGAEVAIDPAAWYHVTIRGYSLGDQTAGNSYYSLYLQSYQDGVLTGERQTFAEGFASRSNKAKPDRLVFTGDASADNIHVTEVPVSSVRLDTAEDKTEITAGEMLQLTGTALTEYNEPMPDAVTYALSGSTDDKVHINDTGLLTSDADAADQTVTVTATSGGVTSDELKITVNASDDPVNPGEDNSKPEPGDPFDKEHSDWLQGSTYFYDNCAAEDRTGALLIKDGQSPNGTPYYRTDPSNSSDTLFEFNWGRELSSFTVWQADIRFETDGAGFTLRNKSGTSGNFNTHLYRSGTTLAVEKGASYDANVDADTWYQITLRGTYGVDDGQVDLYVQAYDSNGQLTGEIQKFENIYRRNDRATNRMVIDKGVSIDNVRVYEVAPSEVKLSAEGDKTEIPAASTLQFTGKLFTAKGEAMPSSSSAFMYELYQDGEKIFPDDISIGEDGLLTVLGSTPEQTITVRATSKTDAALYDEWDVHITPVEMLQIQTIGFNEEYTRLVNLSGTMNYVPDEDLAFVIAVYDQNGALKDSHAKQLSAEEADVGEFTVNVNWDLPADFDQEQDQIRIYIWTR